MAAPPVFRAPSGPPAVRAASFARPARPLAVCAASFARCVGSKPGQAHVTCSPRASSPLIPTNFACNSPVTISNHEFTALELQRFQTLLNLHLIELHATFVGEQASLPAGTLHTGGAWCALLGKTLYPQVSSG